MSAAWLQQCGDPSRQAFTLGFGRDPQGSSVIYGDWQTWGIPFGTGGTLSPGGRVADHTVTQTTLFDPGWWELSVVWSNNWCGSSAGWRVKAYYMSGATRIYIADICNGSGVNGTDVSLTKIVAPSSCQRIFFVLFTYSFDGDAAYYYEPTDVPLVTVNGLLLAGPDCPEPI